MNPAPRRLSFRQSLEALRVAYAQGDAKELHDTYVRVSRNSRPLRIVLPLLEHIYPVRRILWRAGRLEASLARHGLHAGCVRFFDELSIPWEVDMPPPVREIATAAPVLFFGNHPSLFTPFLAAAGIDRQDFRFFSSKYVCHLLPSVGRTAFPIEVPLTRSWTEWRRGGWQRVLVYRLISLLHPMPSIEAVRRGNQRSLEQGAAYIRAGGSAILCPGGGGKAIDRRWYSGIGSLIKLLQESPSSRTIYVLPFREENSSNKRIYAQIRKGPISRFKRAFVYRDPIRIRFGVPIPISELGSPEDSVHKIVTTLKTTYEGLFLNQSLGIV
jgi:hypothetical protein